MSIQLTNAQELLFQNFTLENGYIHNGTHFPHSILKDKYGYVWFTSLNGLSRFDGKYFKNYKPSSNPCSLSTTILGPIAEDHSGNLWIGSVRDGMIFFDRSKECFSKLEDLFGNAALKSTYIDFVNKDIDQNIWFGNDSGLRKWDTKLDSIFTFDEVVSASFSFYQLSSGTILIGGRGGVFIKEKNAGFYFVSLPETYEKSIVLDAVELDNGDLWITSDGGHIWAFDLIRKSWKNISNDFPFNGISPANFERGLNSDIWLRSAGQIIRYNQLSKERKIYSHQEDQPYSLPPSSFADIMIDEKGNLFVSTFSDGIAIAKTNPSPFYKIGDFDALESLHLDEEWLLIRDFYKGGGVYNKKEKKIIDDKLPVGNGNIYSPSRLFVGTLYFGIGKGMEYMPII